MQSKKRKKNRSGGHAIFLLETAAFWRMVKENGDVSHKRMRVLYSGAVQGVGFRYTARTVATGFEVTGTVRNLPDGRVEMIAEGARAELEAFRQALRESGLGHFIGGEDVSWGEAGHGFRGFEIVR